MRIVPALTHYLEMKTKPENLPDCFPEGFVVSRLPNPDPDKYLEIYRNIGEKWKWYNRLLVSREEIQKIIQHPDTRIYILHHNGRIIGFAELDMSVAGSVEIVYFGLSEAYIGKGLGKIFFGLVLQEAWNTHPERVWLHTCELDHPAALDFYRKAGFREYHSEYVNQTIK
ncbi:MAG: GNAT family N-acetyltransferase [Bacteroidetes bacterium]|nr:GNAT family N-acetyltransferase [Bacteroidota bacterium]